MNIIFATHAATVGNKSFDGLGNTLTAAFRNIPHTVIHLQHSIDGGLRTKVIEISSSRAPVSIQNIPSKPQFVRWLFEFLFTLFFIRKMKTDVFIGIDPLNALAGTVIGRWNKSIYTVFFVADYSPSRFSNRLLNWFYHSIEQYCLKHADEVWVVSSRIKSVLEEKSDVSNKIKLTPNCPPSSFGYLQNVQRNKYQLVTTGIIQYQFDFDELFKALQKLVSLQPKTRLLIIGDGKEIPHLKEKASQMGIAKKVVFTGHLPLSETLRLIASSGIGLALYNGLWEFNHFGDSTKAREYFFFGLPVLSTDSHSTVDEITENNAGIVVPISADHYVEAIQTLWENYSEFSLNAFNLGHTYTDIHLSNLQQILNSKIQK